MLTLSYINSKGEPLNGGFTIPCDSCSSCEIFVKEAEQHFSEGKDYILRDTDNCGTINRVIVIAHKWHHSGDVYYAKLESVC